MTQAKEMGKELFTELLLEERKEKLNDMVKFTYNSQFIQFTLYGPLFNVNNGNAIKFFVAGVQADAGVPKENIC